MSCCLLIKHRAMENCFVWSTVSNLGSSCSRSNGPTRTFEWAEVFLFPAWLLVRENQEKKVFRVKCLPVGLTVAE